MNKDESFDSDLEEGEIIDNEYFSNPTNFDSYGCPIFKHPDVIVLSDDSDYDETTTQDSHKHFQKRQQQQPYKKNYNKTNYSKDKQYNKKWKQNNCRSRSRYQKNQNINNNYNRQKQNNYRNYNNNNSYNNRTKSDGYTNNIRRYNNYSFIHNHLFRRP